MKNNSYTDISYSNELLLESLVCLRVAMKFNDTLDEHYNEYENIEFVQSEASDTGDEEAEQEQTSGYQKLLDIFVSHII